MRERISYYSDGLKLSGILNTPDNSQGKRFPGVVLVPGFMSTADAFFPGVAEEFKAAEVFPVGGESGAQVSSPQSGSGWKSPVPTIK
jgi:hypothetical protein